MLLHAAIHWPHAVTLDLWPFAVDYAVHIWNRLPREDSGIAPLEIFCGAKLDSRILRSMKVWGCPVYVLDPTVQDGKKLPRWKPKSRRGQFMGFSKRHANTVGLIRNLTTGSISTQFHVVYDDWFTTIPSTAGLNGETDTPPTTWDDLLTFQRVRYWDDAEDGNPPELAEDWLDEEERNQRQARELQQRRRPAPVPRVEIDEEERKENEDPPAAVDPVDGEFEGDNDDNDGDDDEDHGNAGSTLRRNPPRQRRGVNRFYHDPMRFEHPSYYRPSSISGQMYQNFLDDFGLLHEDEAFLSTISFDTPPTDWQSTVMHAMHEEKIDDDGLLLSLHPLAFAVKANSLDTPNFHEAMNGPDSEGFYKAMETELEQLESMNAWEVVPRSEAEGMNVLDSTWAFKRKRYPDGGVRKLKARLCVRGDQQIEGVDFFETYAPVVAWSTVRLLLVLMVTMNLASKQVDYTLAFVHADLEDEIYVEMPRLFQKPGHVLKLKKSLYGLRQSPLNFFLHLKEGLEARGFRQSELDPCLFISNDVLCLCYVDDCLFFSKDERKIDEVIEDMKRPNPTSFLLNVEDSVAGFLGILMEPQSDGTIELKQTGLIDRILRVMNLQDSKENQTPSDTKPLGKDENGPPCEETWSYASVVGMMMYLASNSRPDIAFAVHSAARFTHCPRRSHEKALKKIARYLKGTRDRGMIIKPSLDLSLDCYADADFAGLWNAEVATDPTCVRSRTGFVISLGGTPVLWASKLQTEITLSTTESEYVALSTAMRSLLPLRQLVFEVAEALNVKRDEVTKVCRVWEDNRGALTIANAPFNNMTPRTKHLAVKLHWFKSHIKPGEIEILPIHTSEQKADGFTKGLGSVEFVKKRKLIMGW